MSPHLGTTGKKGETLAKCKMCDEPGAHGLQFREGDHTLDKPGQPNKSHVVVISLCHQHWIALKQFLGI